MNSKSIFHWTLGPIFIFCGKLLKWVKSTLTHVDTESKNIKSVSNMLEACSEYRWPQTLKDLNPSFTFALMMSAACMCWMFSLCHEYKAPTTGPPAPGTQSPAPSTKHQAPSTQHRAPLLHPLVSPSSFFLLPLISGLLSYPPTSPIFLSPLPPPRLLSPPPLHVKTVASFVCRCL